MGMILASPHDTGKKDRIAHRANAARSLPVILFPLSRNSIPTIVPVLGLVTSLSCPTSSTFCSFLTQGILASMDNDYHEHRYSCFRGYQGIASITFERAVRSRSIDGHVIGLEKNGVVLRCGFCTPVNCEHPITCGIVRHFLYLFAPENLPGNPDHNRNDHWYLFPSYSRLKEGLGRNARKLFRTPRLNVCVFFFFSNQSMRWRLHVFGSFQLLFMNPLPTPFFLNAQCSRDPPCHIRVGGREGGAADVVKGRTKVVQVLLVIGKSL